jgi:hypothetical protein
MKAPGNSEEKIMEQNVAGLKASENLIALLYRVADLPLKIYLSPANRFPYLIWIIIKPITIRKRSKTTSRNNFERPLVAGCLSRKAFIEERIFENIWSTDRYLANVNQRYHNVNLIKPKIIHNQFRNYIARLQFSIAISILL